jgi:hypothetical protein|eukprot:4962524-Prymnesium_polylepis.3
MCGLLWVCDRWLRLLDATLRPPDRFFSDDERRSSAGRARDGWHAEHGGLEALPELDLDDVRPLSLIWHAPSLIWHALSLIWHAPSLIWHAPSLI